MTSGGMMASCQPASPVTVTAGNSAKATGAARPTPAQPDPRTMVYVGTYAAADALGIYSYRLDPATGVLEPVEAFQAGANPSFLAFHPHGRTLYAVNELISDEGNSGGAVSAFAVDPRSGRLTFLNRQPTLGGAPCHLTTDQPGNYLLVANYVGGSLAVYPLQSDGRIGGVLQVERHHGRGVDPERQEGSHVHSVDLTSDNRFVLSCDLGLDKVFVYPFDPAVGSLLKSSETALAPGAGPRHLAFHPTDGFVYVINELDSTIAAFAIAADSGALTLLQTLSTLPGEYTGRNAAAEVCVHASGKFVYGSNRGHDSIVIYAVESASGLLQLVGHEPTRGKSTRHIAIDPTGTILLAANQDSNAVTSFQIDAQTGRLHYLQILELSQPVCLKFWSSEK